MILALTLWGCAARTDRISPGALQAGLQQNPEDYVVVDVRTGMEFNGSGGHIAGAIHMAYPGALWHSDRLADTDGKTLVLICLTGHRSRFPLGAFGKQHPNSTVVDLDGGMRAWWGAGLPTEVTP